MRLIDADSLMEKLNGIWDCNDMTFEPVDGCCIDADCKSCRWRETIEYVKRLVQNQTTASPWHRVEDGLPPKATWVLTVATDGNVKIFNIATVDAGGQWWTYSPQKILRELYGVRYWMPIEPPKEEEHGN